MFQRGTKVGCCAIMHEERKRGSKAASSKGNKRRQTGVCLPEAPLNLSGRGTNRHPHTPTSITHSRSKWWPGCYADKTHTRIVHCLCAFLCTRASVCAKVPTSLVMVQTKPVSAPAGHKETGSEQGKKVGWMERRGKNGGNEGTGLYSCWLPSLEASNSLSWGVCQPLVGLSCLLLITVVVFLLLLLFVFCFEIPPGAPFPLSLKVYGSFAECKLLRCVSQWGVRVCRVFLPLICRSLEWLPPLSSDSN